MFEDRKTVISQKQLTLAWFVWGLAVAFYFSDYLARVAPGVMHRSLQMDLGISEAGFAILTASFYLPYILMQIPVGLTVDRLSIRTVLTFMSLITALGCCVFAFANGLLIASLGRMLIGFSAAFGFVSALRLATSWFPSAMLGLLSGMTQSLGMLGAAAGAAPVAFLVMHTSWRTTLFILAGLFICLSFLLFRYVQDRPGLRRSELKRLNSELDEKKAVLRSQSVKLSQEQVSSTVFSEEVTPMLATPKLSILQSLSIVLSHPQTWINAMYAGFLFVPTAVIGEALGPAYLQYGRGLTAHAAAIATSLIFIGWGLSGPLSGWLSDRVGRRKPFMIGSALCGIILTLIFVFKPTLSQT